MGNGCTGPRWIQDGKVDLFFFNPGKIKSGNNNFQMSELNVNSGIIDHFTGLLPDVAEIKGFFVSGDIAVTACNMKNEQAAVFFIDTRKKLGDFIENKLSSKES